MQFKYILKQLRNYEMTNAAGIIVNKEKKIDDNKPSRLLNGSGSIIYFHRFKKYFYLLTF